MAVVHKEVLQKYWFMPSERAIRKLYVNGLTICIEFFFHFFQIFQRPQMRGRQRRWRILRAWGLISQQAYWPMKSGQNRKQVHVCIACHFCLETDFCNRNVNFPLTWIRNRIIISRWIRNRINGGANAFQSKSWFVRILSSISEARRNLSHTGSAVWIIWQRICNSLCKLSLEKDVFKKECKTIFYQSVDHRFLCSGFREKEIYLP